MPHFHGGTTALLAATTTFLAVVVVVSATTRPPSFSSFGLGRQNDLLPQHLQAIQEHLHATQRPAVLLGIRVYSTNTTNNTLSLCMDLHPHNVNVHGTAFAGSLYSLAVLTSYYLAWNWLRVQGIWNLQENNDDDMQQTSTPIALVAKSGKITYRRPVTCPLVIATSDGGDCNKTITGQESKMMLAFQEELKATRKAYVTIGGVVRNEADEVAVEYSIELCAYFRR